MKCATCSLCRAFSSFGNITTHGYQCEVSREVLFQMTDEDAEWYYLDRSEIGYLTWREGPVSLKQVLPSGFDGDSFDVEYKVAVKNLLLGNHPCILGSDRWIPDAGILIEEYEGYVEDQRRKIERDNDALARLLRIVDRLRVVKEATTPA